MEACILHCDLCCTAQLQVITEVLQNEKFWITWKNTELDFSLNTFFHEFHQAIISFQDSYCKLKIFLMEYFSSSKVAFMSGSELIIHCPKKKKKVQWIALVESTRPAVTVCSQSNFYFPITLVKWWLPLMVLMDVTGLDGCIQFKLYLKETWQHNSQLWWSMSSSCQIWKSKI